MPQTLSFPGLGLEFTVNRVAFRMPSFLGGWPVYWYGIILAAAFLVGAIYILRRVKLFGLDSDRAFDVVLVGIIGGIVGARLYYVAFTWNEGLYDSLLDIASTRNGGLAIYGGLIGGVLAGLLMCRLRRVKLLPLLDVVSCAIILGQAVGRWANFINIEAFGSNTDLPWGMTSPVITDYLGYSRTQLQAIGVTVNPAQPVHPTFLYESLWCLAGFVLLHLLTKKRRFDGQISLLYLVWYGTGRFLIEGLRTDSLLLGSVRISQLVALLCVLAAGAALMVVFSRIKRESDPEYLKLYVDTEEGQAVLSGEFYKKKGAPAEEAEDAESEVPDPDEEGPEVENEEGSEAGEEEAGAEAPGEEEAEETEADDESKEAE